MFKTIVSLRSVHASYVRDFHFFFLCLRRLVNDKLRHIRCIHIVDYTHARWQCFPENKFCYAAVKSYLCFRR